jgi:plasmid stability protein
MAATKKRGRIPAETPADPKMRPVRLELPEDVHRLLRLIAAEDDRSMASYARRALEDHLRGEAKRLGIKI